MTVKEEITEHATRAFFANAWADWNDEYGSTNVSGKEIMDVMPNDIDPAAKKEAATTIEWMEEHNQAGIEEILEHAKRNPSRYADRPCDEEHFGHYLAMQAMGTGVGLESICDADAARIKVPCREFSYFNLDQDEYPVPGDKTLTFLYSYEDDKLQIDFYECDCGFHVGLDSTYSDQVGVIRMNCPSCKVEWQVEAYE